MGRSRLTWACLAVTPWFVGVALLLSTTAEAGQDASLDGVAVSGSLAPATARAGVAAPRLIQPARFTLGSPEDLAALPDEIDPDPSLKTSGAGFPSVERGAKGDPFMALRPGFDARLHRPGALQPGPSDLTGLSAPAREDESNAGSSPQSPAPASAPPRAFDDGATPAVPLSVSFNSASPAPGEGIARIVGVEATVAAKSAAGGRPNYAALIDPKDAVRQQRCLAEAIYFESRSEPELGQAAVAQVVLNRVKSGDYPANVCGVVYQDRNRPFACQFSFACEGKSLRIEEPGPWATAVRIASGVTSGALYNVKVGEAVNYHANYVLPYWASTLKRVAQIGNHIFYETRARQN